MRVHVALSKLHPSRRNPRWVKPKPDAHQRMLASIRAFGLLEPLVVRPMPHKSGEFRVIAGERRLLALRQIHRQSKLDPKIPCEVRDVDDPTASAMSLSENFVREAMHPLDEAEAFAKLATDEAKGAEAIALQFGVTERYVRQRMKLAALAEVIKVAFRDETIDIGTAEVFASVPEDRQETIWRELNGHPRHAQQVRNIIAAAWIDAAAAVFDVNALPDSAVSRDLFSDKVLVERTAFMEAQSQALAKERESLREEGWAEVVTGRREDVQDRLYTMNPPHPEFDVETRRKLAKLGEQREKLEAKLRETPDDDEEAARSIEEKMTGLDQLAEDVAQSAAQCFGEKTKGIGTVFLTIDPDGQVRREFRVPRPTARSSHGNGAGESAGGAEEEPRPPTSDDLSERQLASTFTHHALAVREALINNTVARNRILALILHEKVRSEALAIRHDANAVTLHATMSEGFESEPFQRLTKRRADLDPFVQDHFVDDEAGYQRLSALSDADLAALIGLLVSECLTTHLQHRTKLVHLLAAELQVNLRQSWRPDAQWLAGFQKIQLSHLMGELHGSLYDPSRESRKKSELVETLANLFADAAEGKLEDKALAERANAWLPANLREVKVREAEEPPAQNRKRS